MKHVAITCLALLMIVPGTLAQEVSATDEAGAVELYVKAADMMVIDSPASSPLGYPDYPPFGAEWDRMAKQAFEANAEARKLVRQAREIDRGGWPADSENMRYLNRCRHVVANQVGDAAMYQHLQGDDADAIESIRDLLHLSELLREKQEDQTLALMRELVSVGIDALAAHRLLVMAPGMKLSHGEDEQGVAISEVRKLIEQLLKQHEVRTRIEMIFTAEWRGRIRNTQDVMALGVMVSVLSPSLNRAIGTLNRVNAERTMAAMSLACQLYRFEKGHWPAMLADIVPAYLPKVPIDPWGDGTETFGYVLVEGGMPDGSDRPLVYSRAEAHDGLFYRVDKPQYGFYGHDGTRRPRGEQIRGGQFRDVGRWQPDGQLDGAMPRPLKVDKEVEAADKQG